VCCFRLPFRQAFTGDGSSGTIRKVPDITASRRVIKAPGGKTWHPVSCRSLPFSKLSRETSAMALSGKLDLNSLPPGEKRPTVRPGRAVQFGPSLRKGLRDGPQVQ